MIRLCVPLLRLLVGYWTSLQTRRLLRSHYDMAVCDLLGTQLSPDDARSKVCFSGSAVQKPTGRNPPTSGHPRARSLNLEADIGLPAVKTCSGDATSAEARRGHCDANCPLRSPPTRSYARSIRSFHVASVLHGAAGRKTETAEKQDIQMQQITTREQLIAETAPPLSH